jgi:hypothetical protein
VTDLFVAEVATGSLRRLTNDPFADLHPAWSPDGTRIAFVTDRFTSDTSRLAFTGSRLAIIDAVSGDIRPVTAFDSGKHINPQWAPDGNGLYFISDRDGIPNIYRVSLARGGITQITNLETGAAGISEISPAYSVAVGTGRVAFSAFLDGDYDVFVIEPEAAAKGMPLNMALAGLSPAMLPPAKRPLGVVAAMLNSPGLGLPAPQNLPVEDYDPSLSLDYIAPPQISVGMSNFGSFLGGGTAFYFSDLLGYHNVMTWETPATSYAMFRRSGPIRIRSRAGLGASSAAKCRSSRGPTELRAAMSEANRRLSKIRQPIGKSTGRQRGYSPIHSIGRNG